MTFTSILFPAKPREFPGRRGIKIVLRAAHVLCAGVLTGAWLLAAQPDLRRGWLVATAVSGVAILALDLHESGVFLLQVRGVTVVVKLALLGALPWFGAWAGGILAGLVLLSVVVSHAPSAVRYRVLVGAGRLRGATTRG